MGDIIVLVDDDEGLRDALEMYLARIGYKVINVKNSPAAIEVIEKSSPTLVLCSIKLRDISGIDLLAAVKQKFPDTEVIMMAEKGDLESGVKSLQYEASDFITKPVSSEALGIALQRAHKKISLRFVIEKYSEKLEALHTNQYLYQQLFDEVPCYISIQDKKFRITGTNRRFKEDFGDDIGSFCYKVYKHRKEPCYNCPVEATFRDGKSRQTEEVVTSKSGDRYNVLTWTSPIRDKSGRITQVMEMSTNITQIRTLQDHLTSLGLLIGSISHGMRGILTALDGGIYRLETGIKNKNQNKIIDACDTIKQMTGRMKKMVMDILYYSKERDLQKTKINIMDFADEIISAVKPKAKKHSINLICNFDQNEKYFKVDQETFGSAIINILENSIDACVDDKSGKKDYKVVFNIKEDNNNILFEIIDNGIGMDRETRENMFSLFFSSKGHRGTGLGLFISNRIIDRHDGSITVDSTPGQGSHFIIRVPGIIPEEK